MSLPFAREPLKEFLDRKKQTKKESHEDLIFSFILTMFIISTIIFYQPDITGRVVYEGNLTFIDISQTFDKSTNISFNLQGNVTSIKLSGEFIGNGTGRILLGDLVIVDKALLSKPSENLITGFVVSNPVYKDIDTENKTNVSLVENITQKLNESINLTNITEIVENVSLALNESINLTNISEIIENVSINITIENETNVTETQNITLNVTEENFENQTFVDDTIVIEFNNYCLETCYLNIDKEIVLVIELDNIVLNLTSLEYEYIDVAEPVENITEPIIPEYNLTKNVSLTNITTNVSIINESIIKILPTDLNEFILDKGFVISGFEESYETYEVNLTKQDNYVNFELNKLTQIKLDFLTINDTRVNSDIFVIETNISKAEIGLQAASADTILICKQYENNTCKKWQSTNILFEIIDGNVIFNVSEQGVYAAADTKKTTKEYLAANSVYLNSNCKGCKDVGNCNPEGFCPARDQGGRHYTFDAQLDFDIFEVENNVEYAEVCAYTFIRASEDSVSNYLKDSDISYCGDITKKKSVSNLISYTIVSQDTGWACIPATEILQYHLDNQYSNMFVDWLGQELSGRIGPYNCYYAMHDLKDCENYNPSGADDCRPYLRVEYK